MKRNNLPAVTLAVLLFLLGAAVGALAHRYYTPTVVVANSPERFRQTYVSEMKSKLALSPKQVVELQAILDDTKLKIKAVRDKSHPEMMRIRQEQGNRVKALLTPAQVPGYEKLIAERERLGREQAERDRKEEAQRSAQPKP